MINWKEYRGNRSWPNLKHYIPIFMIYLLR